jgi:hypothetical protein
LQRPIGARAAAGDRNGSARLFKRRHIHLLFRQLYPQGTRGWQKEVDDNREGVHTPPVCLV